MLFHFVLVKVAARSLDPDGGGDATRFQRLEAGSKNQPFGETEM